jgi:hypothetical protein
MSWQGDGMKLHRKRILVIAGTTLLIALFAGLMIYRPKQNIVIEVEGLANREYSADFIVDGRLETQSLQRPRTFTFRAREVSYRVTPADKAGDQQITGHIFTEDGFADGSSTGWSVGGGVSCPNVMGFLSGTSIWIATYGKDSPGPEVTTREP